MTSRAAQALPLLLQSPPGQVPNVHDGLMGLVGSEGANVDADVAQYKELAAKARAEYNVEQLIVVDVPNLPAAEGISASKDSKTVLCKSAVHPSAEDRFLAPRHKLTYKVDHATLATSDPKPYAPNKNVETFRSELERLLGIYIQDKYATGVADVFAVPLPRTTIKVPEKVTEEAKAMDAEQEPSQATAATSAHEQSKEEREERDELKDGDAVEKTLEVSTEAEDDPVEVAEAAEKVEENSEIDKPNDVAQDDIDEETHGETQIVIHIVANKYKLSNFWSGRWRSTYTLASPSASQIDAHANIQVHYFEEGNVQLHTRKADQITLDTAASDDENARAKGIVRAIQKYEDEYQQDLIQNSSDLGEGAFKALRRQLPMTRQKIDWDKVLNYKLGSELSKS